MPFLANLWGMLKGVWDCQGIVWGLYIHCGRRLVRCSSRAVSGRGGICGCVWVCSWTLNEWSSKKSRCIRTVWTNWSLPATVSCRESFAWLYLPFWNAFVLASFPRWAPSNESGCCVFTVHYSSFRQRWIWYFRAKCMMLVFVQYHWRYNAQSGAKVLWPWDCQWRRLLRRWERWNIYAVSASQETVEQVDVWIE